MPINELVDFCYENYNRIEKCSNCPNPNICKDTCEDCLDDTYYKDKKRVQNCENITFCYVCNYIYKYSSEIEHLLNNINLEGIEEFNILSLGCGPCSDLFGFNNYFEKNENIKKISYRGIDINPIWKPIQNKIKNVFFNKNIEVKIFYQDVIEIVNKLRIRNNPIVSNFLVLNYALSDILNKYEDIRNFKEDFVGNLINNLIIKMPLNSFIIINDINLGKDSTHPRTYYETFYNKISETKRVYPKRFHFAKNEPKYYKYGTKHNNNRISSEILKKISDNTNSLKIFNPRRSCTSAQIAVKILS